MRPGKLKVVYWNNIPAPYMVDRFNALVDRGRLDLEVWFNSRTAPDRSWKIDESTWRFPYRYLPRLGWGKWGIQLPIYLLSTPISLLLSLHGEPSFVLGWMLARMRGVPTGFRVLKTFDSWNSRGFLKNAIKRFMFSRADAIETTGADGRQYAISFGAQPHRIFFASHTVDHAHFYPASKECDPDRTAFRTKHGIDGTVFVYVGRLWRGKGVVDLIRAFQLLQASCNEPAWLLLIGDGVDEAEFREIAATERISNIIFLGFVHREQLRGALIAADVFMFPTYGDPYGIAVDEAMACGLPVISTTSAGEINARVIDGVTGYLVPPAAPDLMAARMKALVTDRESREQMSKHASELVASHTPQKWAEDFEQLVFATLEGRPR